MHSLNLASIQPCNSRFLRDNINRILPQFCPRPTQVSASVNLVPFSIRRLAQLHTLNLVRCPCSALDHYPLPTMPPPIYVAVGCAVIGIAAVIAFKEVQISSGDRRTRAYSHSAVQFVYDPHVAPQIEEWKERRRQRRRGPVEVPVRSRSPDDRTPFGRRGNNSDDKGSGDENSNDEHNADDGMSFELRDLRARETAEWSSTNTQNTLRQRRGRSGNVLDEVRSVSSVTISELNLS